MFLLGMLSLTCAFQQVGSESRTHLQATGSNAQLFGASVACSRFTESGGGYAVAFGAPGFDALNFENQGAVFLYENGAQVSLPAPSIAAPGIEFGNVAMHEGTLVVGAWKASSATTSGVEYGALVIYVRDPSSGAWNEEAAYDSDYLAAILNTGTNPFLLTSFDRLGAVDVYADRIIIGGRLANDGGGVDTGAAFVLERTGPSWDPNQVGSADPSVYRLLPSGGVGTLQAGSEFGSVAIYGDYAVVGARRHSVPSPFCPILPISSCEQGAAFIFHRNTPGGLWGPVALLTAQVAIPGATSEEQEPQIGDEFGFAVDIYDDCVAVGVPGRDEACGGTNGVAVEGNCDTGAVYIWERIRDGTSSDWIFQERLLASGPYRDGDFAALEGPRIVRRATAFERMGYSVAIHGSRIVAGAPGRFELIPGGDGSTLPIGGAYVFERDVAGSWRKTRYLTEYDLGGSGESGAFFGSAVDASGFCIAIGAPLDSTAGNQHSGKGYTFYQFNEADRHEYRAYCLGDRPANCDACPCQNNALPDGAGGCLNSAGGSVQLSATGRASISGDTLRFEAAGLVDSDTLFGVLIVGNDPLPLPGPGVSPGCEGLGISSNLDGMRCVGNGIGRVASRPFVGCAAGALPDCRTLGVTSRGIGPPDGPPGGVQSTVASLPTVSIPAVSGSTAYFQLFYRDLVWGMCSQQLNTSNGIAVTYTP